MIQDAIFTRLSGFAGLTTLIGAGAQNCRLYHGLMPENPTYPGVTYFQVSTQRETAMGANPGIVHARFQFDVWSLDPDEARDVAEQLRRGLDRFRGTNLSGVSQVFDCFPENIEGPHQELVDAVPIYRWIVEVLIQHTE